jgi:hypothetical protein
MPFSIKYLDFLKMDKNKCPKNENPKNSLKNERKLCFSP